MMKELIFIVALFVCSVTFVSSSYAATDIFKPPDKGTPTSTTGAGTR